MSVPVVFFLAFVAKQKESNFAKLLSGGMAIRNAIFCASTNFSNFIGYFPIPSFKVLS
jgi:hypothetical protein